MSKQFWTFLGIGLAVVAVAIAMTLWGTKGSHLELDGKILKVRVLSLNPNASIVVVDFRATNPSDLLFVVKNVTMTLTPGTGQPVDGTLISKYDLENVFKYEKLLGEKYNDALSIGDKIARHQTVDRMVAARFELGEPVIDSRQSLKLQFEDMDGAIAVIQ
ncbi:MAG TPA: hypothetical protein VMB85_19275 [Bryobacteraceae bacterium]|nr:hypothetical protein [Bryobacteraceae bacterium]